MTRPILLLAATLVLVLTACAGGGGQGDRGDGDGGNGDASPAATTGGGGGGGGNGGDDGDACRFVTPDEVEAAFGVEIADVTGDALSCTFNDADGNIVLTYAAIQSSGSIDVREQFEAQRETGEEVEGIGDGAIYFEGGGMYVLKGDLLLNMTAVAPEGELDDAELRAGLEAVARAAAGRM